MENGTTHCSACHQVAAKLRAPFQESEIQWRTVKGVEMPYIDARQARERLDEVFGPFGWQFQIVQVAGRRAVPTGKAETEEERKCPGSTVGGTVGVLTVRDPETNQWITRCDGADQPEFESFKAGISDAFKRACVAFGIGAYLYEGATAVRQLYSRLAAEKKTAAKKAAAPAQPVATSVNGKPVAGGSSLEQRARQVFAPSTATAGGGPGAGPVFQEMRKAILEAGDGLDAPGWYEKIRDAKEALTDHETNTLNLLVNIGAADGATGVLAVAQELCTTAASGRLGPYREKVMSVLSAKTKKIGLPLEIGV